MLKGSDTQELDAGELTLFEARSGQIGASAMRAEALDHESRLSHSRCSTSR